MLRLRSALRLHLLANHHPALHGLRVIAILSVLQYHLTMGLVGAHLVGFASPLAQSALRVWFGMDLFFVLSGFLIGSLLASTSDGRSRSGIGKFYVRRAFRIVPLYWVVLTVLAAGAHVTPTVLAHLPWEYLYLTNYVAVGEARTVMPWAWSLCVEEHFYLIVPVLALALGRLREPRSRAITLVLVWLLALVLRWVTWASRVGWTHDELARELYTRTHTRFDTLIAGVLLAHVVRHHGAAIRALLDWPSKTFALATIPLACLALIFGLSGRADLSVVFSWGTLTSVMYFVVCMMLVLSRGPVARWLGSRVFLRLATLGYGVYLVHPPLMAVVAVPVATWLVRHAELPIEVVWSISLAALFSVSLACAYVLHLVVEKPALWVRDRVAGAPAAAR